MVSSANRILTAVGFVLLATACGTSTDQTAAGGSTPGNNKVVQRVVIADNEFKPQDLETTVNSLVAAIEKAPPKALTMGVVLKELTNFWAPVATGANRAITELGITGNVVGPYDPNATTDAETSANQIAFMQQALATGYNAIGIAPMTDLLIPEINAFVDTGVPVVTLDSDSAASERALYVGTLNYAAGTTGGTTLKKLLTTANVAAGTVLILGHDDAGWADGFARTNGAKDVLTTAGYTVVVRRTDWSSTGEASDVAALQDDFTTAAPPVVGMIGVFGDAYRCAMAAQAVGKAAGDIPIVAFDFDPNTIAFMQSGYIQSTHAQRQYYEGYLVPYILYGFQALGVDKTKQLLAAQLSADGLSFDTGLDVVPAAKVATYNAFLDSIGAGAQ
jgi:ribose transport system substrate-binding protein